MMLMLFLLPHCLEWGFHEEYPLVLHFEWETAFVTTSAIDVVFRGLILEFERVVLAATGGWYGATYLTMLIARYLAFL